MSFWMLTIAEDESDIFVPQKVVVEVADGTDADCNGK